MNKWTYWNYFELSRNHLFLYCDYRYPLAGTKIKIKIFWDSYIMGICLQVNEITIILAFLNDRTFTQYTKPLPRTRWNNGCLQRKTSTYYAWEEFGCHSSCPQISHSVTEWTNSKSLCHCFLFLEGTQSHTLHRCIMKRLQFKQMWSSVVTSLSSMITS